MTIFLQTIIVTPKALESIVLAKKLRQGKNMKSFSQIKCYAVITLLPDGCV